MKRLRGKLLAALRSGIATYTITTCRCKFDSLNMKQMRDLLKDKGDWVFKHHTRKTSRNNKIKSMLDYISTWQDCSRKHSNSEVCLKNLELLNQPRTRNWSTLTKRSRTSSSCTSQWWQSDIWCSLIESDRPEIHQIQDVRRTAIIRELRSDVMQLKASAVPPNLTTDLEAEFKAQRQRFNVFKVIYSQHWTLWTVGMKSTSIRFEVSVLMKVLVHRHHPSAELQNQQSLACHKLEVSLSCSFTEHCRTQHQNWLRLRARRQRSFRMFQCQ